MSLFPETRNGDQEPHRAVLGYTLGGEDEGIDKMEVWFCILKVNEEIY